MRKMINWFGFLANLTEKSALFPGLLNSSYFLFRESGTTTHNISTIDKQYFPRGVNFALIATPVNRAERSLTVNVLRGEDGPEEHRNLPMDEAFKVASEDDVI